MSCMTGMEASKKKVQILTPMIKMFRPLAIALEGNGPVERRRRVAASGAPCWVRPEGRRSEVLKRPTSTKVAGERIKPGHVAVLVSFLTPSDSENQAQHPKNKNWPPWIDNVVTERSRRN